MKDIEHWVDGVFNLLALAKIHGIVDGEDEETDLTDLLADIMHFCRVNNLDFESCLRRAYNHFEEEAKEDEE